jgi:DNA-binding transcriptional LysR family regulator
VRASDLTAYPLVNAWPGMLDPKIGVSLEMLGAFRTGPRRVEASHAAAIRRYVELGFGIGLIARLPYQEPSPHIHERSMSHEFGKLRMHLVWRKGAIQPVHARAFADLVKGLPKMKPLGSRRGRAR